MADVEEGGTDPQRPSSTGRERSRSRDNLVDSDHESRSTSPVIMADQDSHVGDVDGGSELDCTRTTSSFSRGSDGKHESKGAGRDCKQVDEGMLHASAENGDATVPGDDEIELNALVREYMVNLNYKSTAATFDVECRQRGKPNSVGTGDAGIKVQLRSTHLRVRSKRGDEEKNPHRESKETWDQHSAENVEKVDCECDWCKSTG